MHWSRRQDVQQRQQKGRGVSIIFGVITCYALLLSSVQDAEAPGGTPLQMSLATERLHKNQQYYIGDCAGPLMPCESPDRVYLCSHHRQCHAKRATTKTKQQQEVSKAPKVLEMPILALRFRISLDQRNKVRSDPFLRAYPMILGAFYLQTNCSCCRPAAPP